MPGIWQGESHGQEDRCGEEKDGPASALTGFSGHGEPDTVWKMALTKTGFLVCDNRYVMLALRFYLFT
jgi:hypothetical protein